MSRSRLPPPRKSRDLRAISKPLSHTRLDRLIYILVFVSAILTAYYSWRVFQWKTQVGWWWNFASGRKSPSHVSETTVITTPTSDAWRTHEGGRKGKPESVEDRINALADALGVPKKELASAIAGVVRSYVPPTGPSPDAIPVASLFHQEQQPRQQTMEEAFGRDEPPI